MAIRLSPQSLAGKFDTRQWDLTLGSAGESILKANPARVSFLITTFVNDIHIGIRAGASQQQGMAIKVGAVPLQILFRDHGPMVGMEWYQYDDVGGTKVCIIENIYYPER